MGALLITYDLNKPGKDYDALYDKIKGLGSYWWHYLDSTWIVDTPLSPAAASEQLRTVLDASDRLLIINVTGDASDGWLEQDAWNWIKQHV